MNAAPAKAFLTAEWRNLAILNYEIDPAVLRSMVPAGTELDSWQGRTYISVVGFLFLRTRVRGLSIPFHRNFEEVNLRFYVRRRAAEGWRRGVVFIKEIVPRGTIALIARRVYNEPYVALPMSYQIEGANGTVISARYSWRFGGREHTLKMMTRGVAHALQPASEAEFITEHYWGYNVQQDGTAMEYRVEHPPWRVYEVAEASLDCDVAALYGEPFCASLQGQPVSAFLAEGSAVTVYQGKLLDDESTGASS
jgi:uncharacterized protein YqjF (DUF2071 family)